MYGWDDTMPVRKATLMPWLLIAVVVWIAFGDPPSSATSQPHHRPRHHKTVHQGAAPSRAAAADIPPRYLALYRQTGAGARWSGYPAWAVLAGIGKVETDHGRSQAPGVHSGVNSFGCCAGPMQFNIRNGSPSTWDTYGRGSPYDPADAIAAAKRLLIANGARTNLDNAVYAYNHAGWYVARVKALARRYQGRRS